MSDLISRQAAIDAIVNWAESHHENPDGDDCIMIILDVPSAQPEPCEDTVSRNAVCKTLGMYGQTKMIREINNLPSAQAEIIRCKDCKYWIAHDKRCVYLNHGFAPNMWCCHAERRTDE